MRQMIAEFLGNPAAADWHFLGSTATNLQALTRVEWGKENWENCRLWQNLITVLQSTAPNCNSTIWVGKRKLKYKLHDLTRVWQLLSGEKKIDDWGFQSRSLMDHYWSTIIKVSQLRFAISRGAKLSCIKSFFDCLICVQSTIKLNRKVMMMKQKKQAKEMAEKDDHTWILHSGTGVLNGTFGLQLFSIANFWAIIFEHFWAK